MSETQPKPAADHSNSEMPMPMPKSEPASAIPTQVTPPPSFSRQALQLVVIPAVITLACLVFFLLFGVLAGRPDNLQTLLSRLRQSSGIGDGAFFRDPRYKERWLAAANIATLLPSIKSPEQRKSLSQELVGILRKHLGEEEDELRFYLLMAIGQLGQEDGLESILESCDSDRITVLEGAVGGVLSWISSQDEMATEDDEHTMQLRERGVKLAIPKLIRLLKTELPDVQTEAATALGELARPGTQDVVTALRDAMSHSGPEYRELYWNSAVALAKLGDARGSRVVADVLLDRAVLAKAPARSEQRVLHQMTQSMQERVILATLASAQEMTDPFIWDKIEKLADDDPSRAVQAVARRLLVRHDRARGERRVASNDDGGARDDERADRD